MRAAAGAADALRAVRVVLAPTLAKRDTVTPAPCLDLGDLACRALGREREAERLHRAAVGFIVGAVGLIAGTRMGEGLLGARATPEEGLPVAAAERGNVVRTRHWPRIAKPGLAAPHADADASFTWSLRAAAVDWAHHARAREPNGHAVRGGEALVAVVDAVAAADGGEDTRAVLRHQLATGARRVVASAALFEVAIETLRAADAGLSSAEAWAAVGPGACIAGRLGVAGHRA